MSSKNNNSVINYCRKSLSKSKDTFSTIFSPSHTAIKPLYIFCLKNIKAFVRFRIWRVKYAAIKQSLIRGYSVFMTPNKNQIRSIFVPVF